MHKWICEPSRRLQLASHVTEWEYTYMYIAMPLFRICNILSRCWYSYRYVNPGATCTHVTLAFLTVLVEFTDKRRTWQHVQLDLLYTIDCPWIILHAELSSWCLERVSKFHLKMSRAFLLRSRPEYAIPRYGKIIPSPPPPEFVRE